MSDKCGISLEAMQRFVRNASTPQPYRFLHTLIEGDAEPPTCRKHGTQRVAHKYGDQLTVCPECFPHEAAIAG